MKLSILTATYNRANLLPRLYESITKNLINELKIEWLIMDDGSDDNTEEIVKTFKQQNNLTISYFKQPNQGKMQAINNLMNHVTGEIVMDCDSDDYFVDKAFKQIYEKKDILLNDENLYALVFLKREGANKISGNFFKKENVKTTVFDLYFKDEIKGEKIIVFKTEIRKKYNHELENNEKFITEARMYHKIDEVKYVKCFNIPIIEGTYLESGYTNNINSTFVSSPNGYYKYFEEILGKNMKNVKFYKRNYAIKHFILFTYLSKRKLNLKNIKNKLNKFLIIVLYIPGIIKIKLGGFNGK